MLKPFKNKILQYSNTKMPVVHFDLPDHLVQIPVETIVQGYEKYRKYLEQTNKRSRLYQHRKAWDKLGVSTQEEYDAVISQRGRQRKDVPRPRDINRHHSGATN